jgi:serine protease
MLMIRRLTAPTLVALVALATSAGPSAAATGAAPYRPGEVVVGYQPGPLLMATRAVAGAWGASPIAPTSAATEEVLPVPGGESVPQAAARLQRRPGIAYAVPDYLAHVAGTTPAQWVPDDPGKTQRPGGWEQMQWNFLPGFGINAPGAWANLRADGRPGGRGVVVAVLDTGVAYRDWHQFSRSPDFNTTRFAAPPRSAAGSVTRSGTGLR